MADDLVTQRRNFLLGIPTTTPATTPATTAVPATPAAPAATPYRTLLPVTSQVMVNSPALMGGPAGVSLFPDFDEPYRRRNERPGVPLDLEAGADAFVRTGLAFRRSRENQLAYLRNKYGEDAVRESSTGELIFTVVDAETGKPKDIQVDENKMSAKDLIDLSGAAPEIVASIWATRRGRAPSSTLLGRIFQAEKDIVVGSLAGEAAGAAKDVAMNVADYGPGGIQLGEIGRERAGMLGVDVGIGNVLASGSGFFKWLRAPLHGQRGQLQFDALRAQEYFRQKYGVEVPLTVGESTGSPTFLRLEAFGEKRPGSASVFKNLRAEQEQALRDLQARMIGVAPEDAAIGQAAISAIRQSTMPLETAVRSARAGAVEAAETGVQRQLAQRTAARPELFPNEIGATIRNRIIGRRDVAKSKAEELYAAVNAAPGGSGKVFDVTGLSEGAEGVLKKLPRSGDIPLPEFTPSEVVAKLQSLVGLKGQKFSLAELQAMRRDVYDSMPRMEGVPGRGAHYLGEIADLITKAIDDGVASMPTGELKAALTRANQFYKSQVVPYNRVGLTELFRGADEAGHIGDSAVALKLLRNPDQFRLVKEALGEKSPEFSRLKRFVVDDLLQRSSDDIGGTMDADVFLRTVREFRNNPQTREIAKDVLGDDVSKMIFDLSQLSLAKGAKLDQQAVADLVMSGKGNTTQIRKLMAAQEQLDEAFKNRITKAVASGELGEETIRPSEFVMRVVSSPKIEQSEVAAMVEMIGKKNPELLSGIQAKTLQNLMQKASKPVSPSALAERLGGNLQTASAEDLLSAKLQDPQLIAKAKTILGDELWQDLTEYTALRGARELKDVAFGAAGGWSAGGQIGNLINQLTTEGPVKYGGQWFKDFIASKMLLSKTARNWLGAIPVGRRVSPNDLAGFTALALSNPVFLRSVLEEAGDATMAGQLIDSAKASIGQYLAEQEQAPVRTGQEASDFQQARRNFLLGTNAPAVAPVP